jgi:PIN domain nuclease of toxin-antitoxin system
MKALVDTQVWIWMRGAPGRLSAKVKRTLSDPDAELVLSAVTPWEIAIKVRIGKLKLPCSVAEYVVTRSMATRVTPLPITQLHAIESTELPLHHQDPFDRVLIAQARIEQIPIITADSRFDDYDVEVIAAR